MDTELEQPSVIERTVSEDEEQLIAIDQPRHEQLSEKPKKAKPVEQYQTTLF